MGRKRVSLKKKHNITNKKIGKSRKEALLCPML